MIYLRTYFYAPHEMNFIVLNLLESYPYIDKFIVCEFNRTHTGQPKEYIFEKYSMKIPKDKIDKISYFKCDISSTAVFADHDEKAIHEINEPLMRGYFVKCVPMEDNDIIFSVDADEILYSDLYPEIIENVRRNGTTLLQLHQFMYKPTYFWTDCKFVAPTVALYKEYKDKFPSNWRYDGKLFSRIAGCHFSWCMDIDSMISKLYSYGHPQYRFCADKKLLQDAVDNKKYPFDKNTAFNIEEKDLSDQVYPKNIGYICQ